MNRYQEVLDEILDDYRQSLEGVFDRVGVESEDSINKTDSPIEKLLYIQMKADIVLPYFDEEFFPRLKPQYKINRENSFIRVDFLYQLENRKDPRKSLNIVIECDGHDYHEKTKEQAQKDKSRDRFLISQGYHVMRFTGSEIYKSPKSCVREISDFISEKLYGEEIRAMYK